MDIQRPSNARAKTIRRLAWGGAGVVLLSGMTLWLWRLRPAAPEVDRSTVFVDTVKRGEMLREVGGLGTLVPVDIRWIPAQTSARVDKIVLQSGASVKPDSVILELSDPELEQETLDAEFQLKGALASLEQSKAQLENQLADKRTQAAQISSQYRVAEVNKEAQEELQAARVGDTPGLAAGPAIDLKTAEVQAEELAKQNDLAQKEVDTFAGSIDAQLAVQQATVDEKRALYNLKKSQMEQLHVRAGLTGVLSAVSVDIGQQVTPGTNLVRVADPLHLKATIQIPETQAKDVMIGQKASIDTHNGIVGGHVSRVDAAVVNGTVAVDVTFDEPQPAGARPDLSVEGTVQVEDLKDVLYVGRPVNAQGNGTVGLFKVVDGDAEAVRTSVTLGPSSVNSVEISRGLGIGDKVILSDMSAWDNYDRIRLQ